MNAGAYGGELAQVIESVTVLFPDEGVRTLNAGEMAFPIAPADGVAEATVAARSVCSRESRRKYGKKWMN